MTLVDDLADESLPASVLLLSTYFEDEPRTRQELLDEVPLPERTLDRSLDRLVDAGVLRRDIFPRDLRKVVYTPTAE